MGFVARRFVVGGASGASGFVVTGDYAELVNELSITWSGDVAPEISSAGEASITWSGKITPEIGPSNEASIVFDDNLV